MNRPTIILDRDGVINADSDSYIKEPAEWVPLPGSLEAIAELSRAGWRIIVCTNQSGVGRGLLSSATLASIHADMCARVEALGGRIDGVFICPHHPVDDCHCRKPRPGLLLEAADRHGFSLRDVPVVGDSRRDLEAARAVGARPLLVRTGKGQATAATADHGADAVYPDLAAVVTALLGTGQ